MTQKVAVLGGGVASMTAVFALTNQADWQDHYDITVYQLGWRLGGKGASGRNLNKGGRIEEHGLHLFMGFYENAFRMMRRTYAALDGQEANWVRSSAWKQGFVGHDYVVLKEHRNNQWNDWVFDYGADDSIPGSGGLPSAMDYLERLLDMLRKRLAHMWRLRSQEQEQADDSLLERLFDRLKDRIEDRLGDEIDAVREALDLDEGWLLHKLIGHPLQKLMSWSIAAGQSVDELMDGLENALAWLERVDEQSDALDLPSDVLDELRKVRIIVRFLSVLMLGMHRDGLFEIPPERWTRDSNIGNRDFAEWLRHHGAGDEIINSPLVVSGYTLAFCRGLHLDAAVGLYGAMRLMLTYKGHIMYKMQGGMGDVIFAPLYRLLAQRGVKFEFFSRVDDIQPNANLDAIESVHIGRQIAIIGSQQNYQPLVKVNEQPCWPSEPCFEQLQDGQQLQASGENLENWWTGWQDTGENIVLRRGVDFDQILCGISVAGMPHVAADLMAHDQALKAAVRGLETTATQSVQIWFKGNLQQLGWDQPSVVLGSYGEPYDTWADMSHLLPIEHRPGAHNLAYMVGNFPSQLKTAPDWAFKLNPPAPPFGPANYLSEHTQALRENFSGWAERYQQGLWPAIPAIDWLPILAGNIPEQGPIDDCFSIGISNPSDRYVLSQPGQVSLRLENDGTRYHNLILAGDWTNNAMNAGCVEGAVMSGLKAARAMSPLPIEIVGD